LRDVRFVMLEVGRFWRKMVGVIVCRRLCGRTGLQFCK
jgi:hypothetical protein